MLVFLKVLNMDLQIVWSKIKRVKKPSVRLNTGGMLASVAALYNTYILR